MSESCEVCLDHYRPDFDDIPLEKAETVNTAHCPYCHSRAQRTTDARSGDRE